MEENKIEYPQSDSNVNSVGDISTEEVNQAMSEVESPTKTVEIENEETDENVKTQELLDLLSVSNDMKAYKAARRVGERRKVSKKEFKKKKAKRRMVKKSKK